MRFNLICAIFVCVCHTHLSIHKCVRYTCSYMCWLYLIFASMNRVIRIAILELHGLKTEHFPDIEKALEAADKFIAHQRSTTTGVAKSHPDIIIGDPMLDQFWYGKHQGIHAWGVYMRACCSLENQDVSYSLLP